ncbi:hypothetical protein [Microcoleus sp. Z1_B5]|uniref:hypothetical protein n=1 Tax=Microcoleus sp. Z1_B5 TaxID=3055430 RepID=UPI002FD4AC4F
MNKLFLISLLTGVMLFAPFTLVSENQGSAEAQVCRRSYQNDPGRYRNRTAHLALRNNLGRSVRVTLYHPDSQTAQGTWRIESGFHWVNRPGYIIADNWGVQFDNGCIFYLGEIADYGIGGGEIPVYTINLP